MLDTSLSGGEMLFAEEAFTTLCKELSSEWFIVRAHMMPNAPMNGAGARSTEASAQLAGWAAAILLFELSELPLRLKSVLLP